MNQIDRNNSDDSNTPILIIGGLIGVLIGVIGGRLYADADAAARERDERRAPQGIKFSLPMALPFALTIISLLRQIRDLANNDRY
ncbi:MAG TPA: hypothetical protein VFF70_05115 [Anaerolineae bacterium]|nr:hypothetical protein [Anaerolineae bacterium]